MLQGLVMIKLQLLGVVEEPSYPAFLSRCGSTDAPPSLKSKVHRRKWHKKEDTILGNPGIVIPGGNPCRCLYRVSETNNIVEKEEHTEALKYQTLTWWRNPVVWPDE